MKTSFAIRTLLGLSLLFAGREAAATQPKASASGTISGRLFDGETQEPIPHANVILLRASDNRFVKSVETDANGVFRADKLPLGQYKFRTTVLGYHSINPIVAFHARRTQVALGSVVMVPLSTPQVARANKQEWAQRNRAVAQLEPRRPAVRVRS